MKIMKRFIACAVFVVFLCSLTLANGLNVNGLGARAIAMGGAFVGLADDFTAIFWNPAGIAQFSSSTFGLSVDDVIPSGTYQYELSINHPLLGPITVVDIDAKMETTHNPTGIAAYYHPISENLVFGLGVYTPSGLASKWDGADFTDISFSNPYKWDSKIGIISISPALAYKVSEQVMVGATLNINYGMFEINTHAGSQDLGIDIGQQNMKLSGWGVGATFGLLVKPSEMFSLGATFRTPSKINFSGDVGISKLNILGMAPGPLFGATIPTTSETSGEVNYPMWVCGGVAFKPVDNLTLTADLQYTNWDKIDVIKFELTDPLWQAINAKTGGELELVLKFEDAIQYRFGAEYRINSLALRAGYYYDPSPAPKETHNVLVPNYDFNCFAFGFGYAGNGFHIDFFFELLKAKERVVSAADTMKYEGSSAMPGTYNLTLYVPGVSIGYSW